MSTIHDYQAAIDIMAAGFDAKLIANRLAKHHPDIFVKLVNLTEAADTPDWQITVVKHVVAGNYVGAIKEIRTHTGFGLKEAKDINDNLVNAMVDLGYDLRRREAAIMYPESPASRTLQALFNTARAVKQYYA